MGRADETGLAETNAFALWPVSSAIPCGMGLQIVRFGWDWPLIATVYFNMYI